MRWSGCETTSLSRGERREEAKCTGTSKHREHSQGQRIGKEAGGWGSKVQWEMSQFLVSDPVTQTLGANVSPSVLAVPGTVLSLCLTGEKATSERSMVYPRPHTQTKASAAKTGGFLRPF